MLPSGRPAGEGALPRLDRGKHRPLEVAHLPGIRQLHDLIEAFRGLIRLGLGHERHH
jgi:hypothetical protein